jgi:predicted MFS family arabinose efflux permease
VIAVGQALGSAAGGASLAAWGVPAIPATALSLSLAGFAILSVAFPRRR